jgi:parallel beta-helix repeat protein
MEATFSRNHFIANRIVGSDHGLWGGYSYNSVIAGNTFERNRVGIAIEHGQDNAIVGNTFDGDSTHIYLWANKIEPGDWGYPKHRDTRSRNYNIAANLMSGSRVAFRIGDSRDVAIVDNEIQTDSLLVVRGDTVNVKVDSLASVDFRLDTTKVLPLAGGRRVLPSEYAIWPRSSIIVDEWGPYDWKSPKLWPKDSATKTPLTLRVLTPLGTGNWRVLRVRGAQVSPRRGVDGDTITVRPASGDSVRPESGVSVRRASVEDWEITLEYRGRPTRSPRGVRGAANAPYVFSYSRFDPRLTWDVKVFAWGDSTHPLNAPDAFSALLRGERGAPALTRTEKRLDYMWYRPRIDGWPVEKYGVAASADVELPAGSYTLRTISDDGIRVYVNDKLVIERWNVHGSEVDEVPISAGRHSLKVEYFQGDGWAELRVEILKRAAS